MIAVSNELVRVNSSAKILLQIHDELLISVPNNEIDIIKEIVVKKLSSVVNWRVPLEVKVLTGNDWAEVTK